MQKLENEKIYKEDEFHKKSMILLLTDQTPINILVSVFSVHVHLLYVLWAHTTHSFIT